MLPVVVPLVEVRRGVVSCEAGGRPTAVRRMHHRVREDTLHVGSQLGGRRHDLGSSSRTRKAGEPTRKLRPVGLLGALARVCPPALALAL